MLRRVLSIGLALFGTIVALILFWMIFMPWLLIPGVSAWGKLALAFAEFGFAIYAFARWRSWPALLLLVGSIPMLLDNISYSGFHWRMDRIFGPNPQGDSALLALLFPSNNEESPMHRVLFYVWFLNLCLPVSFFWYLMRVSDRLCAARIL